MDSDYGQPDQPCPGKCTKRLSRKKKKTKKLRGGAAIKIRN